MRKRRGFTLIELIAVLTLLTVLMAALVTALTAYIRRAKEQLLVSNARTALLAAQILLTERYGEGTYHGGNELTPLLHKASGRAPVPLTAEELLALAELSPDGPESIWLACDEQAAVTMFVWTESGLNGSVSAVWDGKSWTVCRDWAPE